MPDVQEVFRMATQKVRPEPGFVDRQYDHQRRRLRSRKASVYVAVAAIGVVAAVVAVRTIPGESDRTPIAPLERPSDGMAFVDLEGRIVGTIGADGNEQVRTLLSEPLNGFSLSPDGTRVVLTDGTDVYTMGVDGTDLTRLTQGVTPSWSPDGSLIAFGDEHGIHVMSPDGTGRRTIVSSQNAEEIVWPAWSPDGERIAYQITYTTSSRSGIYVVDAGGGQPTRLTRGSDAFPSWHPDGASIVFTRVGETQDLYTVASDGSARATRLAATDRGESIGRWSPSGDLLAFVMFDGLFETDTREMDVHVLDMSTGADRVVLEGALSIGWASDQTLVVVF